MDQYTILKKAMLEIGLIYTSKSVGLLLKIMDKNGLVIRSQ